MSAALTDALERHGGRVQLQYKGERLDEQGKLKLKPDITWWRSGRCCAVIDARYKALADGRFPNADSCQMLAYCTALRLDGGYLIYAKDSGEEPRRHQVRNTGTRIDVEAIDAEQEPADVLAQVEELARRIAQPSTAA